MLDRHLLILITWI